MEIRQGGSAWDITILPGLFVSAGLLGYQLEALEYKLKACICTGQAFVRVDETFFQESENYLAGW